MGHLLESGLARSIGVCGGFTSQARLEALSLPAPSVNQIDIGHLKNKALISYAKNKGIHLVANLQKGSVALPSSSEASEVASRLHRSVEEVMAR